MPDSDAPARHVLTPSALNRLVGDLLGDALPLIWIEGELSNVARPASGHLYFTLKDAQAQVRCAMFKPKSTWLKFKPTDGMHVLLQARVGLYQARGEFQLIAEHMEEAGEGALQREFERLKAALQAEGLFDTGRKRALPRFARRIGVITSASGAAVRDVISVLGRRFPLAQVDVLPVPVQGREAPPAIVRMLGKASASSRYDVLLLTRGGGSLEDLWAFNDESVARAVHASAVPVVCAVGHEVDFSIAEFVADLRAPTPSAAAELLVPDAATLTRNLQQHSERLRSLIRQRLQSLSQRADHVQARLHTQRPQARLAQGGERLLALRARLQRVATGNLHTYAARLKNARARLNAQHPRQHLTQRNLRVHELRRRVVSSIGQRLQRERERTLQYQRALHAVSPLATLDRGYAIVLDEQGQVIRSAATVAPGATIHARLADGTLHLVNQKRSAAKGK